MRVTATSIVTGTVIVAPVSMKIMIAVRYSPR